jgi:hypothetical protein
MDKQWIPVVWERDEDGDIKEDWESPHNESLKLAIWKLGTQITCSDSPRAYLIGDVNIVQGECGCCHFSSDTITAYRRLLTEEDLND